MGLRREKERKKERERSGLIGDASKRGARVNHVNSRPNEDAIPELD
jgi:hypothetical protein